MASIHFTKSSTTGNLSWSWGSKKNVYRSYENAKTFIRSLEFDSLSSYREFTKMHVVGGPLSGYRLLPADIPIAPECYYFNPTRTGKPFDWHDYIGVKKKAVNADGKWYMPYEEFKKYILKNKIRTYNQYRVWRITDDKHMHLPRDPEQIYSDQWEGWYIMLGKGEYTLMDKARMIMPIDQAIKFIHQFNFKSQREFDEWWKETRHPMIPSNPHLTYKKDWIGWPKFLGYKLTDKIEIKKLNVDVFVIAKLKHGNNLYRIYIDEKGYTHVLNNRIDEDTIIDMFNYNNSIYQTLLKVLNAYCIPSTYGNTIVEINNVHGLIRGLNVFLEPVKWKEVGSVMFNKNITLNPKQLKFANNFLQPGRDPIFDQRPYIPMIDDEEETEDFNGVVLF